MATLFEEAKIKDLVLRNRTIRSATYEGMADREGHVTDRMINLYRELAAGGAALIFPGPVYAEPGGQAYLRQISIVDDTCREGLINLVKAIHSYGALAGLNISHAGLFRDEKDLPGDCVGPVVSEDVKRSHMLSPGEIKQIEKNFTYAAKKGKQVGFDCVQVHAAHGYLLSEFISPAINTRTDEYGGSVENRARFACEIIDSIRQETSPSYPILAKLNTDDFLEGGLTIDDAIYTARLMNEAGLDAIELTGGTMFYLSRLFKRHSATSAEQEGYYPQGLQRVQEAALHPGHSHRRRAFLRRRPEPHLQRNLRLRRLQPPADLRTQSHPSLGRGLLPQVRVHELQRLRAQGCPGRPALPVQNAPPLT